MNAFAKVRHWVNRDDGRFYRAGNGRVGFVEAVGLLLFIAGLLLWQVHTQLAASAVWSYISGAVGLVLVFVGNLGGRGGSRTWQPIPTAALRAPLNFERQVRLAVLYCLLGHGYNSSLCRPVRMKSSSDELPNWGVHLVSRQV